MSSLRPSRTLQNLEVSGLRYARNEVPANGGLMQVEPTGEVVISRNVELDTLTVIGETTLTGDVLINTTLTANTVNTTNLNVSGPSILTGPVTSLAGITASSLYVSNGITAGGSLDIGGTATIHGLLTAAAGITTTHIETDSLRARDIAVDTLHVVTIDDVNVVSSVSTNVVRGVQIVAGTEDPLYTFLSGHTLDISGSAYITNNLGIGVTGTTAALDVSGAAIFRDLVTANAGITASSMNVSGPSTVYGTQSVYDLLTAFGGITSSMINVSGAATVYGDSTVKGLFTASGGITGSSLDVAGVATVYGAETVKGLLTAEGGITSSSLVVSNGITGLGTLNITGAATFNSTETVNGLLTATAGITSSSLDVSGNTTLYGTETVKGLLTAEGGVTSSSLVVSNGITGFGTLNITGAATFNSTETVNGLLTATAGITSSSLNVAGNTNTYGLLSGVGGISASSLYVSNGITAATLAVYGTICGMDTGGNPNGYLDLADSNSYTTLKYSSAGLYSVQDYLGNPKVEIRGNNQIMKFGEAGISGAEVFTYFDSSSIQIACNRATASPLASYLDIGTDRTNGNNDYALRLIRYNSGSTNADSYLTHRGTNPLYINTEQPADIVFNTNGTERARVTQTGLTVSGPETVTGLLTASGGITASSLHVSGTITYGSESFDQFNANAAVIGTDSTVTAGYKLDVDGKSRFRDVIALSDGTAGAPSLGFYSDTSTGLYKAGNYQLGFVAQGGERLRIVNDKVIYVNPTTTAYNGGGSGYPVGAWALLYSGYSDAFNSDGASYMAAQGLMLRGQDLIWNPSFRSYGSKIWIGGGRASPSPVTATNAEIILETGGNPRLTITGGGNSFFSNNVNVAGDLTVTGNISGPGVMPVGSIVMHAGSTLPTGWLYCDGTSYSTSAPYASLFSALNYTFGGSGSTFNVPDMRDRFVVGAGTAYSRNDKGGNENITLSISQLPAHDHPGSTDVQGSHSHTATTSNDNKFRYASNSGSLGSDKTPQWGGGTDWFDMGYFPTFPTDVQGSHSHSVTTSSVGSGASIDIRPKYIGMYYIIKY